MQKLNVPIGLASPAFIWAAQNSQQSPSDPNLSQIPFDLLEMRALVAVPNSLLRSSVPAFDELLGQLLARGAGNFEDAAFHSTTDVSGGPKCIYANSGITSINAAGNGASGGNLLYGDLLAVLQKAAEAHAAPPFAWFMSARSFYLRILGLLDGSSRPLAVPTQATGLYPSVQFTLFGWPVFISSNISNTEAVSSGTNQSHIVFTNAQQYFHIAQDQAGLAIQTSLERFFDSDQTAVRAVSRIDFAIAPAAACIVLKGVN
jgi:HK97 family phage major capsid protein